ncbi:MAG: RNA helicase [Deltaproteobacteria bacterium]|nr:RNA helicase [Deltaproteobacteria bacterium]
MAETWVSYPELEDIIGKDKAGQLCRLRGGTPLYIPVKPNADHYLARTLGLLPMRALCLKFPAQKITVPNGRKAAPHKDGIIDRLLAGRPHASIALELGVTERYVRMIAADMPCARQLRLPFGASGGP